MSTEPDARAELAEVAASLRAYLEMQVESGAVGIPRGKKPAIATQAPAPAPIVERAPAPVPAPPAAPAPDHAAAAAAAFEAVTSGARLPASASASIPTPTLARLPLLAAEVASCTKCVLSQTRTQTVFSRGNPEASLCFIGEAPGADEDATGVPFVGRAGQLLDKMIGAMGISPENDVYVCNILKCRPPGNRKPEAEEMATCFPYLHEQLAIVKPKVIVAMGNTAVQALLGTTLGITKVRGAWKMYKGIAVMPTYHPSYLLRPSPQQAEAKKQAWEDLQAVMKQLGLALPKR